MRTAKLGALVAVWAGVSLSVACGTTSPAGTDDSDGGAGGSVVGGGTGGSATGGGTGGDPTGGGTGGSATGGGTGGTATGGGTGGGATGGGTGGSATGGGTGGSSTGGGTGGSATGGGTGGSAACVLTSCGATPDQTGPFAVKQGSLALPVGGSASTRKVQLTTFTPTGATSAPVVIITPGFQLAGSQYASYAQHLASRGYVAVIADQPDAVLFGPTQKEMAGYLQEVIGWVEQQASDGGLAGVAAPSFLGLAGHSMGGKLSLLVAANDARPRAVFGLDPVDAAGANNTPSADYPSVTPERMGDIHVPIGLTGELTNATCTGFLCQACAPAADNYQQYADHSTSPTVSFTVVGANHMSFVDDPSCALVCTACDKGTDSQAATRAFSRRAMTAFFDLELRGDTGARDWLAGAQVPELLDGGVTRQVKNGF